MRKGLKPRPPPGAGKPKAEMQIKATCRNSYDLITKCDTVSVATTRRPLGGSGTEELIKRALMGALAPAVIALAPLCIPPAQAHADDPCVSITDPAAHQACIDESLRDDPMDRYQGNCQSSPFYGQLGQLCRDFWVRKWLFEIQSALTSECRAPLWSSERHR